jgi:hypothetical protein
VEKTDVAYIVQANDSDLGGVARTVADRKLALALAVKWATDGRTGLKISGDGRIYTPAELARMIINN